MSAPHDPTPVDRAADEAADIGGPWPAVGCPDVADLVAALALARAVLPLADTPVAEGDPIGPGSSALLAGLHLDLAVAELAHASGSTGTDWIGSVGDGDDGPGPVAAEGRLLVERCLRDLQGRLRRGPAERLDHVERPESLAYTRAVLHLHAAQRTWPAAGSGA